MKFSWNATGFRISFVSWCFQFWVSKKRFIFFILTYFSLFIFHRLFLGFTLGIYKHRNCSFWRLQILTSKIYIWENISGMYVRINHLFSKLLSIFSSTYCNVVIVPIVRVLDHSGQRHGEEDARRINFT